MANYYTHHTADDIVLCSQQEFIQAAALLGEPDKDMNPERHALWTEEDCEYHGFDCSYIERRRDDGTEITGLFLFAEESGTPEDLPSNFCELLGSWLTRAGNPYLELGYASTCSELVIASNSGGQWRLYPDGSIVYPTVTWPGESS